MTLFLGRDTKVYIQKGASIWEIPVLNGYALNQSTNSSTVEVEEMADLAGNSRRGQQAFNDSISPAEWSFDVYTRPYLSGGNHRAVEEPLWASLAAGNPEFDNAAVDPANIWSQGLTVQASQLDIDFNSSNKVELGTFDLIFVFGANLLQTANYVAGDSATIYRIPRAVVNEVNIPFDVNGITSGSWSGMGGTMEELAAFDATGAIRDGVDDETNFIRSRFTALSAVSSISGAEINYGITLTGGNITISNNISFLTPEELGKVNKPITHVTGTRSVSGSFSAYMDSATNGPIDLVEDMMDALNTVTNRFALDFYIGGKNSGSDLPVGPGIQIKLPQAHLEIPQVNPDDIISIDVNFTALPTSLGATDEIERVTYVAA